MKNSFYLMTFGLLCCASLAIPANASVTGTIQQSVLYYNAGTNVTSVSTDYTVTTTDLSDTTINLRLTLRADSYYNFYPSDRPFNLPAADAGYSRTVSPTETASWNTLTGHYYDSTQTLTAQKPYSMATTLDAFTAGPLQE